jgi:Cu2+-exporting ATPase
MTCTGCETKLKRTLGTLAALTNLKTSLVLARTEFDIDPRKVSAEEVIKHLHRTTEFKCERVTNQGSSLDIICSSDPVDIVNGPWPDGVIEIKVTGKNTICVDFDAKVIGARDLLQGGWKEPMQLAPPRGDLTLETGAKHVRHVGYMTILSAVLTIPVLVLAWAPLPEREIEYASASLALATIVQVVVAGPFYPKALKALVFSKVIEMDLLIVLSTSAAYIFSVVSFGYLVDHRPLSTGQFFETSTLLVTLIMVGRYVAALARQKAVESISIRSLQTSNAALVKEDGTEEEVDTRLLQFGDVFVVSPDSRLPTDGTVLSGSSEIDESMLTGESKPVEKHVGSPVVAGSINGSGTLQVRLTRLPGDNTISTIADMVDEAKLSKPKIQDIADQVASYFVPVVISLTIITFVTWVGVGIGVRKQSGSEAVIQAITYAITVLIVSCPCAIGLAVPMVIVMATGIAADHGVIFKTAESIEVACRATDVVFDKTGTLTEGKLSVVMEYYDEDVSKTESTKSLLLGLIGSNKHPVSSAVAAHLASSSTTASTVLDPKNITGKGVEGRTSSGQVLCAGNSRWLPVSSHPQVQSVLSQGSTAFCFTVDGTLAAVYGLDDTLRDDALSTVSKLHEAGIATHILSGDDDGAVRAVAALVGIPDGNIRSRCSPGDKQGYIQDLLSAPTTIKTGRKGSKPVVVFCGDGTNDAVALAQATIGIHMNEGTDVAQSAADVVLMRPHLSGVLTAIAVSRKSMRRVAFNFGWSFVYNLFAILLAAGAFVNARIPPEYAGLGELVSVLPVIAAAMLMRWSKI